MLGRERHIYFKYQLHMDKDLKHYILMDSGISLDKFLFLANVSYDHLFMKQICTCVHCRFVALLFF